MKVLFAVSNEEISDSIVKKYQKEYKQIISYKNVYYFNAIVKELQKDKTYDRIVISEDLEAFTHTQYDQIDKFIFEKLDSISDEASNIKGNDTPIILICSDRRTKSEEMLVKLFGIGVYNAIIGNDRSVDEVCRLINRPRVKKEAKSYYQIDTEEVKYQAENENNVSEMEIQNIVAHYKRLGKDEDRYIDSFNNIAAQYNDTQLRIITKFLPLNVRAVLEEKSPKYQQIMSFNNSVSNNLRKPKNDTDDGPSQVLLKAKNREKILSKPVVIPSAVNMSGNKKLAKPKVTNNVAKEYTQTQQQNVEIEENQGQMQPQMMQREQIQPQIAQQERVQQPIMQREQMQPQMAQQERIQSQMMQREQMQPQMAQQERVQQPIMQREQKQPQMAQQEQVQPQMMQQEMPSEMIQQEQEKTVKRGRGRPKKVQIESQEDVPQSAKRGRGRPKKNVETVQNMEQNEPEEEFVLPGLEEQQQPVQSQSYHEEQRIEEEFLPGFDENDINVEENEEDMVLPGLNNLEQPEEEFMQQQPMMEQPMMGQSTMQQPVMQQPMMQQPMMQQPAVQQPMMQQPAMQQAMEQFDYVQDINNSANEDENEYIEEIDLSTLLTPDKKIATFIGTSKNGTSFIVNNLAELMSSIGINTAILDTTKNKNSYYIYTKNEEPLRELATHSIEGLAHGLARGIHVNKNLTVYTSLPNEDEGIKNVDKVLETLLMNHSLILIDTDFETPINYFKQSQETYLVQTMDILTIQPLTAFLKQLKVKNILDERKLRIVLNKVVKIKGIKDETIIGGLAFYNDPSMSFMTELFDRDRIKYVSIPFDEETYIRYLEGVIECEISLKGYSKVFIQTLRELGNMLYPMVTATSKNSQNYQPPTAYPNQGGNFSNNMNSTLNQMRRNY